MKNQFKKYLLNNGFKFDKCFVYLSSHYLTIRLWDSQYVEDLFTFNGKSYKQTLSNAKLLIDIDNKIKYME